MSMASIRDLWVKGFLRDCSFSDIMQDTSAQRGSDTGNEEETFIVYKMGV